MEQHYKLYLEVLVLCVIYSLRVLSKLSVDLTTLYIFFSKERIPNFHWLLFVLILMLLTSLLLPHCLTNWALPVDNLQASSVGFITLTADRQHDPSFWQATGVRLALTGQSVSTNRLAAVGVPGILTTAQGRVEIGCVCKEIFFQMILRNCNVFVWPCISERVQSASQNGLENKYIA